MNFDTLFDPLPQYVRGVRRPHLYDDTPEDAKKLFALCRKVEIIEGEPIDLGEISKLFNRGDKLTLTVEDNEYDKSMLTLSLEDESLEGLIDIDIQPSYNEKTRFYEVELNIDYRIITKRIDDILIAASTEDEKRNFSDSAIVYLRNLVSDFRTYKKRIKYKSGPDTKDSNYYAVYHIELYILRLFAHICTVFSPFCTFKNTTEYQWHLELFPEFAVSMKRTQELLERIEKEKKGQKVVVVPETKPVAEINSRKTSFGFTGDPDKLLSILSSLQLRMRKKLINEAKCSIEDLHLVFTTDSLSEIQSQIFFSCETTQLAYLLRKLKPFFINFEDELIESSNLLMTIKGSNLSAQNIRKSFSETPEPKDFDVIDQLVAELSRS